MSQVINNMLPPLIEKWAGLFSHFTKTLINYLLYARHGKTEKELDTDPAFKDLTRVLGRPTMWGDWCHAGQARGTVEPLGGREALGQS